MEKKADSISVDEEVERLRALLRQYVEASGIGVEALIERLEMNRAAVSKMFQYGGSPLKLYEIFGVLEAIGIAPKQLFGDLYATPPEDRNEAAHRRGSPTCAKVSPTGTEAPPASSKGG
jgi:hypothetical protein